MAGRFSFRRSLQAEPGFVQDEPAAGEVATIFAEPVPEPVVPAPNSLLSDKLLDAKVRLHRRLIEEINLQALERLPEDQIRAHVMQLVSQYILVERLPLNTQELNAFVSEILDEMTGLGPLEPLLKDPTVNDILINGHECVYVEETQGVLEPCGVRFKDRAAPGTHHQQDRLGGRPARPDESHPMCDARPPRRLARQRAAVQPIGIDGPLVSIRANSPRSRSTGQQAGRGRRAPPTDGGGAARRRRQGASVGIISGGTGSGKTTMLNALSAFISEKERLLTIEDAAELQLQQPHVGRMETRPPNLEGKGEIRQRELVKNALRMRPDTHHPRASADARKLSTCCRP